MSVKPQIDSHVSWHVELSVRPNKLEEFKKLTSEMVASTRTETGVLAFERFVSDDGFTVHIYERYSDSEAAVAHLINFKNKYSHRFAELVDRKQFDVFGAPSSSLAKMFESFGAKIHQKLDGFTT